MLITVSELIAMVARLPDASSYTGSFVRLRVGPPLVKRFVKGRMVNKLQSNPSRFVTFRKSTEGSEWVLDVSEYGIDLD